MQNLIGELGNVTVTSLMRFHNMTAYLKIGARILRTIVQRILIGEENTNKSMGTLQSAPQRPELWFFLQIQFGNRSTLDLSGSDSVKPNGY